MEKRWRRCFIVFQVIDSQGSKERAGLTSVGSGRIGAGQKIAFVASNAATAFSWGFITSYFMMFCTDAAGIPVAVASIILLASRLIDGFTDALVGNILDRTVTRWGRYRLWIALLAVPVAVLTSLLFYSNSGWSDTARIVWVIVVYFLYLLAFTGLNTSLSAMSSVMSGDPCERANIISWQRAAGIMGALIMAQIAAPWFESNGSDVAESYVLLSVLFGFVSVPLFLLTPAFCKERIMPDNPAKKSYRLRTIMKQNVRIREFRIAFVGHFLNGLISYGRVSIFVYYFKYVAGNMGMYATYILVMRLSQMLGAWSAQYLMKWFKVPGKALVVAYVLYGLILVTEFFVPPAGETLPLFWVLVVLASFLFGVSNSMVYIIIPDLVDYCEYRNGTRNDGGIFALLEFGNKVGMALGTSGIGFVLSALGYTANMAQTGDVVVGINALMFVLPGIFSVLIGLMFVRYHLSRTHLHAGE